MIAAAKIVDRLIGSVLLLLLKEPIMDHGFE